MKLNNSALQELYDTVVNYTITFPPYYGDTPIDKAFKECDEKLSESITFAHIKDLQDRNDILEGSNKALLEANMELASKKRQLEKDLDFAKNGLEYARHSRDTWRSRAKHAEKEVEDLKKQVEDLASQYQKLTIENKRLQDANTTLEKASDDRTNLQEVCDKLSGKNRGLNARIDCLRLEVNWYRKHFKEQSDKILGLKSRLNSMCGDEYLNKLLDSTRDTGYEQGQKDLWDKLSEVADATTSELLGCFADVCECGDLITWDLEAFMDEYKKWQEKKKETEHMQEYLESFCMGRLCYNCPLHTGEFMCGRDGKWFCDMTGEDLKKYYEKARACSKPVCHFEREYTFEGTINIEFNKDLLNKVCGIDSDD